MGGFAGGSLVLSASARDAGNEAGEAFAHPSDEDAVAAHLYATLSSLADRDVQRTLDSDLIEVHGVEVSEAIGGRALATAEAPELAVGDVLPGVPDAVGAGFGWNTP